jgi:hypothetical protein
MNLGPTFFGGYWQEPRTVFPFFELCLALPFETVGAQDGSLGSLRLMELLISHPGESSMQSFSTLQKAPMIQIYAPLSGWLSRVDPGGTDDSLDREECGRSDVEGPFRV